MNKIKTITVITYLALAIITFLALAALTACDKQTKHVQAVARCVLEDPRLSAIVKDIPKARQWISEQRQNLSQIKTRVKEGASPFAPDDIASKILDVDDILSRLDTCLGVPADG